jgi:hypothetical protein
MDLLAKSLIAVVAIIIILFAIYFVLSKTLQPHLTQSEAIALISNDILRSNPGAIVNVSNVTPSTSPGSWHVLMSVIFNATSPCPSYYIYSFDYPQYGFVYRVQNIYTSNCTIHGLMPGESFVIASYPVAIVRSYTLGIGNVSSYVQRYGYNNVDVTAAFHSEINTRHKTFSNAWLINYSAAAASYSTYVLITQLNGTLLLTYNVSH